MKKSFILSTYALIALVMTGAIAHAETAPATTPLGEVAGVTTQAPTTPTTPVVPQTLTARKAAAEAGLRAIYTQFSLFTTRTQLTIDRLTAKGIDATVAQTELTSSIALLKTAKTNLDLFAAVIVTDDMSETTELKNALVVIQNNLKDARTHLINSLTALKTSVSVSIEAQS